MFQGEMEEEDDVCRIRNHSKITFRWLTALIHQLGVRFSPNDVFEFLNFVPVSPFGLKFTIYTFSDILSEQFLNGVPITSFLPICNQGLYLAASLLAAIHDHKLNF
jgi:hypothetical protein